MKSTILVALVLIIFILFVVLMLKWVHKQTLKAGHRKLLEEFKTHGDDHELEIFRKQVLLKRIIAIDLQNRKLMLMDHSEEIEQTNIWDLSDILSCEVIVYEPNRVARFSKLGNLKLGPERQISEVSLRVGTTDEGMPNLLFPFFRENLDPAFTTVDRIGEAEEWRDLILVQINANHPGPGTKETGSKR